MTTHVKYLLMKHFGEPGMKTQQRCERLAISFERPKMAGMPSLRSALNDQPRIRNWSVKSESAVKTSLVLSHKENGGRRIKLTRTALKGRRSGTQKGISNLQILCNDCNMGKGSRDQTYWNAPESALSTMSDELGNIVPFPNVEGR